MDPVTADSICVGQRRPQDEDERVLLFLVMKPGVPQPLLVVISVLFLKCLFHCLSHFPDG